MKPVRFQERKRTAACIHSRPCHMLCDDVHQTKNVWTQKSKFMRVLQSLARLFQCQGCKVGGEAENCLTHGGSAPHRSELQGFQVLHTRCKMGTGPGQTREPSHLHWCERQNARLWKPMSHAPSVHFQSIWTWDAERAHCIQQCHWGAAGSSCQFRSWHETLEHQRFLCHHWWNWGITQSQHVSSAWGNYFAEKCSRGRGNLCLLVKERVYRNSEDLTCINLSTQDCLSDILWVTTSYSELRSG